MKFLPKFKILLFFVFPFAANILQPINSILLPQSSNQTENDTQSKQSTLTNVGQTWTNAGPLNIDLDNLMGTKSKSANASLSMNQLKLQSPVKQQQSPTVPPMMISPTLQHINNAVNNNFNSVNNNFGATVLSPTQSSQNSFSRNIQQHSATGTVYFGNATPSPNPNVNNLNNQFNAFQ